MGVRKHTSSMPDYGSALQFGLSITPETARLESISELVQLADITGLDLLAIQDHAYNHMFLDTWTLIAFLAARTSQINFMPDVADLPLRPPPMLAKAVATLDRLTEGRAELVAYKRVRSVGDDAPIVPRDIELSRVMELLGPAGAGEGHVGADHNGGCP